MKTVFADSSYFLALVSVRDEDHVQATEFSKSSDHSIVTTAWVLVEVANGLASSTRRHLAVELIESLVQDENVEIVAPNQNIFAEGFNLYSERGDKDWSLTDCISFVVMKQQGLTEALTGDHHFEQAGFRALLLQQD